MTRFQYVLIGAVNGSVDEDAEAYGPFSSAAAAERARDAMEEEGVRPVCSWEVIELWGVRTAQEAIREAKRENDRADW